MPLLHSVTVSVPIAYTYIQELNVVNMESLKEQKQVDIIAKIYRFNKLVPLGVLTYSSNSSLDIIRSAKRNGGQEHRSFN